MLDTPGSHKDAGCIFLHKLLQIVATTGYNCEQTMRKPFYHGLTSLIQEIQGAANVQVVRSGKTISSLQEPFLEKPAQIIRTLLREMVRNLGWDVAALMPPDKPTHIAFGHTDLYAADKVVIGGTLYPREDLRLVSVRSALDGPGNSMLMRGANNTIFAAIELPKS